MKCPNCGAMLRTVEYEGIHLETCRGCQGEWLDADELKHVVQAREVRFDEQERRAIAESTTIKGVKLDEVDRDLACPKCGGETGALKYGGDTGIVIDRCTTCHGIWLDADELERIQMLVEGWDDGLKDDLAKYGPKMRKVAADVDQRDDVDVSSLGFMTVIINGILDII